MNSGNRRTLLTRIKEHPVVAVVVAVALVIGFLISTSADLLQVLSNLPPDPSESSPPVASQPATLSPPSPSSTASTPSSTPTASHGLADGCFDVIGGLGVDCADPHRLQQIPAKCTADGLVDFMGGQVGIDVPFDRVAMHDGVCWVDFGEVRRGSIEGVLDPQENSTDQWRRCLSVGQTKFVRCDVVHWGEYIASTTRSFGDVDSCTRAADAYLGGPLSEEPELKVVPLDVKSGSSDPARCVVGIVGARPLVASVRRLGVQTVPLQR